MDELKQKEALFVAACKYIKELKGKNAKLKSKNADLEDRLHSVMDGYNTITVGDIYYCKACYNEVSTEGESDDEGEAYSRIGQCDCCGEMVCRQCFDIYPDEQHPVCPLCVDSVSAECDKCGATVLRRDMLPDMSCPVCAKQ